MDFKISINDPDILEGIAFARQRDNAARAKEDAIESDEAWIEIELMHTLKQTARQKCESEAQQASAKIMAEYDAKMAAKDGAGGVSDVAASEVGAR